MRWIPFWMLLYVACALQLAHLGQLSGTGLFQPQYLAVLTALYAMYAQEEYALLAGFWCGMAYDVLGPGHALGFSSLVLVAAAWLVVRVRGAIFHEHALTQAVIGAGVTGFFLFCTRFLPHLFFPAQPHWPGRSHAWWVTFTGALYSMILTPLAGRLFVRWRHFLGFDDRRTRIHTRG